MKEMTIGIIMLAIGIMAAMIMVTIYNEYTHDYLATKQTQAFRICSDLCISQKMNFSGSVYIDIDDVIRCSCKKDKICVEGYCEMGFEGYNIMFELYGNRSRT
jgi:hypothetical protein